MRFPWVLWSLESSFLASHLMKVQNLASVLRGRCGAFNAGLSSRGTFLLNIIRLSSFIYLSGLEETFFLTGLYVLGSENLISEDFKLKRFMSLQVQHLADVFDCLLEFPHSEGALLPRPPTCPSAHQKLPWSLCLIQIAST